jgi:hypothetical protein
MKPKSTSQAAYSATGQTSYCATETRGYVAETNMYIARCNEAARLLMRLLEALPMSELPFSQRQRLRRVLERISMATTQHLYRLTDQ